MIVFIFLSNSIPSLLAYEGLRLSTVMFSKLLNALLPIAVTADGMVTLVKPLPENADLPIVVTEEGIVTLVKLLQSLNA